VVRSFCQEQLHDYFPSIQVSFLNLVTHPELTRLMLLVWELYWKCWCRIFYQVFSLCSSTYYWVNGVVVDHQCWNTKELCL